MSPRWRTLRAQVFLDGGSVDSQVEVDPISWTGAGVELSESPAVHTDDTNTVPGGPSVTFDLFSVAWLAPWNTSAGVR